MRRINQTKLTPREKIELEVIRSSIKHAFRVTVKNTITHALSILKKFDIDFLDKKVEIA